MKEGTFFVLLTMYLDGYVLLGKLFNLFKPRVLSCKTQMIIVLSSKGFCADEVKWVVMKLAACLVRS